MTREEVYTITDSQALASRIIVQVVLEGFHFSVSAFYKGESQEKKQPRRLEGAECSLRSPAQVMLRGSGYSLFVDPFCFRDGAFGF